MLIISHLHINLRKSVLKIMVNPDSTLFKISYTVSKFISKGVKYVVISGVIYFLTGKLVGSPTPTPGPNGPSPAPAPAPPPPPGAP